LKTKNADGKYLKLETHVVSNFAFGVSQASLGTDGLYPMIGIFPGIVRKWISSDNDEENVP